MWSGILQFLQIIYLLLPAGFANIAAALSPRFAPAWNFPLDCNALFRGKRILGTHKTFRGLFFGIAGGILGSTLQYSLLQLPFFSTLTIINYSQHSFFIIGALFGTGAVFGDALKSFFKRRLSIKPGKSFMPFDQIDWVLGSVLFIFPLYPISFAHLLFLCLSYFLIHLAVRYLGFLLHLNKEKL